MEFLIFRRIIRHIKTVRVPDKMFDQRTRHKKIVYFRTNVTRDHYDENANLKRNFTRILRLVHMVGGK